MPGSRYVEIKGLQALMFVTLFQFDISINCLQLQVPFCFQLIPARGPGIQAGKSKVATPTSFSITGVVLQTVCSLPQGLPPAC